MAVHFACQSLLRGECEVAIAGACSIAAVTPGGYFYQESGILSPDGHCRAFDAAARGTVPSSGVGVVVLKRLDKAREHGNQIRAVIKGSAVNNDGASKVGYTAPSVEGQRRVIDAALVAARLKPHQVTCIEAHGTGTPLGDAIEVTALRQVFAHGRRPAKSCALGSVKTNIGHCDAAAGMAGLIKTVLCLEHRTLVPSLHFKRPNPQLELEDSPFFVPTRSTPWRGARRRAGVSSFGIGGTNAHLVLEEAPLDTPSGPSRPWQVLTFSAQREPTLDKIKASLEKFLLAQPEVKLADLAFTLNSGRKSLATRQTIVCASREEAVSALLPGKGRPIQVDPSVSPSVVFLFPGPDGAWLDSGRELYGGEGHFRDGIDRCCKLLRPLLGVDLSDVLFSSQKVDRDWLDNPFFSIPALFAVEYAMARLWMAWGIQPAGLIGDNVGYHVAAAIDGVLELGDALTLLVKGDRDVVRFDESFEKAASKPDCILLEVGPGTAMGDVARQRFPQLMSLPSLIPGEPAGRVLLSTLGRLWCKGATIDWQAFYGDEKRRLLALPTYPFQRKSYWINAPDGFTPARVQDGPQQAQEYRLFAATWKRAPLSRAICPAKEFVTPDQWLVFVDKHFAIAESLVRRLRDLGQLVSEVRRGSTCRKESPDRFTINPGTADDYKTLFDALSAVGRLPTRILHAWGVDPITTEDRAAEIPFLTGFDSVVYLTQLLDTFQGEGPISLALLTSNVHQVLDEAPPDPAKAAALATVHVLPKENSRVVCSSLDIDLADLPNDEWPVEAILAELALGNPDASVAYRRGLRWVPAHDEIRTPSVARQAPFADRGVYVITHALQEIGLALAERLARNRDVRIVLVDRTFFPVPGEWERWISDQGRDDRIARKITRLEALGERVRIVTADPADREQMRSTKAEAERNLGPIVGIFHLEPALETCPIRSKRKASSEILRRTPAEAGILEDLFDDVELLVLFSNNLAECGEGDVEWAARNIFFNRFAERVAKRRRVLALAWANRVWRDVVGDTQEPFQCHERKESRQRLSMTSEGCLDALERALELGLPGLIVSTRDLAGWMEQQRLFFAHASCEARRENSLADPGVRGDAHTRPNVEHSEGAPRNEIEKHLAENWKTAFGRKNVSIHDNFFELGGHSLLAVNLLNRLNEAFAVRLSLDDLFHSPTIAKLAERISGVSPEGEMGALEGLLKEIEGLSEEEVRSALRTNPEKTI